MVTYYRPRQNLIDDRSNRFLPDVGPSVVLPDDDYYLFLLDIRRSLLLSDDDTSLVLSDDGSGLFRTTALLRNSLTIFVHRLLTETEGSFAFTQH